MYKILQIIPTLDRCGAEKQLTLLAAGLPKDQFEVHVAVLTRTGPLEQPLRDAEIPLHFIHKKLKLDLFAYLRLKSLILRLKPDLVHTWLFAGNSYGRLAAMTAKVPKIVAGERCVDPWKSGYHFAIDRYFAQKTDVLVTNSGGVVDFYKNHGLPEEKFMVIPNAVLSEPPSPITRDEMFRELRITPSRFVIGIVARLWPQKRIRDAVWAADMLKFAGEDIHLLVFGDGPERDALLRYREDVCISDRVHFFGNRNDVPRFLPHFDLLWSTSAYEGQSNSILEAMCCGVPVIASDIPGNRDLVQNGVTGYLIPEFGEDYRRRTRELVKRTTELLETPERRLQFGQAGRSIVESQFTLTAMIQRHVELYSRLLK
ncbi:MAG: glycosyltransferase [Planctomycetaceae bacterium]|jgi:glycosyltransferase involved in cell wall biosynthesis|nr:glycosyltransferase [Planctomycetaceae bacterium]